MILDQVGKLLQTNELIFTDSAVLKRYRPYPVSMLWGFLERKPYSAPEQRCRREAALLQKFRQKGLNVPELVGVSIGAAAPSITVVRLELTDLVADFHDPSRHIDDKLSEFAAAIELLHSIHNLGESHGDAYLKNFARNCNGEVYAFDFENERIAPCPQAYDVVLLTANAISALGTRHKQAVLAAVRAVYDSLSFPFDLRDKVFFSLRFQVSGSFFGYFGASKTS